MAYAHMFYGDFRKGDNPRTFLRQFEEDLAELPQLSETEKCYRFYNYCRSGSDAEYWYEELERNSPIVLTSWFTLANHFRVRWLNASPNILLEIPKTKPVTIIEPDTATTISRKTSTTTTAIPAPANTPATTIYETTTTTEPVERVAGARHVIATSAAPPTQQEYEVVTTTAATGTDPNNTITTVEQQDIKEPAAGREENRERRGEEQREQEVDTGERERIQSEVRDPAVSPVDGTAVAPELHQPVRFAWATDNDESPSPAHTFVNTNPDRSTPKPATTQIVNDEIPAASFVKTGANEHSKGSSKPPSPVASSKLAPRLPENPVPSDVPVDPVRTGSANAAPSSPTATQPIQSTPPPSQLDRATHKPTVTPQNGDVTPGACTPARSAPSDPNLAASVPTNPVPIDPDPGDVAPNPAWSALANTAPTSLIPVDPAPAVLPLIDPDPGDKPVDTDRTSPVPSSYNPAASVPINSISVDPDPGNVADPIRIAFASAAPVDSVSIDPDPVIHPQFDRFRRHYSWAHYIFRSLFSLAWIVFHISILEIF